MTSSRRLTAVAVAAAVLAGCVGGGDVASDAGRVQDGDEAGGSIAGFVLTDSLEPLQAAIVATLDGQANATTAPDGSFLLTGLPPGTYQVVAQKLGYDTQARSVTVTLGETAEVSFNLAPLAVADPFIDVQSWSGLIECAVGTPGLLANCVPLQFVFQQINFNPTSTRTIGLFAVVEPRNETVGGLYEMEWQRATGVTAESLALLVEKELTGPTAGDQYGSGEGSSPLRVRIGNGEPYRNVDPQDDSNNEVQVRVFPAGTNPPTLVVNQRFDVWSSVFYHDDPGPSYSALADE